PTPSVRPQPSTSALRAALSALATGFRQQNKRCCKLIRFIARQTQERACADVVAEGEQDGLAGKTRWAHRYKVAIASHHGATDHAHDDLCAAAARSRISRA